MFRLLRRSTICFLLLVIWYGQGRATLVPRMSLDEMVDLSACVVEAKVGRSWSAWDPAHQFIWTHYEIEVHDWLKAGATGRTLILSEPGGTVDGLTMRIAGAVPYEPGEHVVLFLYRTPVGYLRVTGYGQGKYSVLATSSEQRIRANLAGAELVRREVPMAGTGAGPAVEHLDGIRLEEFKIRVRQAVARRRRVE